MGETRKDDSSHLSPVRAPGKTAHCYTIVNLQRGSTLATQVRLAGTSAARRKGLLGMGSLESGSGLWIAPCEAIHTFGMKMSIDAIFLDREHRVKKLKADLRPFRIAICLRACSVLELEAGTILRTGTKVGDCLLFQAAWQP